MNNRPKTAEELMKLFLDNVHVLTDEWKEKMKYCEETKQNSDDERLHYTVRLLQKYINHRCNIPV